MVQNPVQRQPSRIARGDWRRPCRLAAVAGARRDSLPYQQPPQVKTPLQLNAPGLDGPGPELAEPFDMSLPAISKHLKVLERAGLISRGRDAQRRPCRLETEPLQHATEWMERYRRLWEQRLDRLDDYLQVMKKEQSREKEKKEKRHARK